ncbi:MAG: DUF47 family protein [Eggerthellaceae bacterium]|jgi:uncharacterized protein Yka (UPF0111/DUF47 family)|nr:DUF47 family protein [Eggerthellaceae bacterium]MDR2715135.1 DUF47 family protein [Coriobacteriaceae bacterium]
MAREKFDYFGALERQGKYACEEALMLVELFRDFDPATLPEKLDAMHAVENSADQQNHEIFTHVATEFLTPLEKEDIVELAHRLDDICDYIDDVTQQLYMYDIQDIYPHALAMAEIIEQATARLVDALREFRNFRKSRALADHVIEINDLEEEADKLYLKSIRDLYVNHTDEPVYIMAWSNVFARMERCIDACENVADMMGTVVLKNS